MQVKKDKTYNLILKVAKSEFLTNGYKNTSMRIISKKSGIGLSNIYNYFKNKNELFVAVLNPLLAFINNLFEQNNNDENISLEMFSSKDYQTESIKIMLSLVEGYRDELDLLLFHSYGSSLERFRDDFSDKYTQAYMEYFNKLKEKYPTINIKVSNFFIHTLSSWVLTILGEIVSHKELTHQEIEDFMSDYVAFTIAGWKKIISG